MCYVCIHIYLPTYIHTNIHTYLQTKILQTFMHTYLHICKHTHKNSWCTHLRINWKQCALIYTYVCICIYIYSYTYTRIYIHTYILHTYIHTNIHADRHAYIHIQYIHTLAYVCMWSMQLKQSIGTVCAYWGGEITLCVCEREWERVCACLCAVVMPFVFVRATRIQPRSICSLYHMRPR